MSQPLSYPPRKLVPKARGRAAPRTALSPLIGRDALLVRVAAELGSGTRLLTVTGPPGIGKTRFATACLEQFAPDVAGHAWFCDLSQVKTEKELRFAVLTLLSEQANGEQLEQVADDEVEARVVSALSDAGRALLVLDNFEQIVFAAPAVDRWCRTAPSLSVLVTSRERLAVDGEVVIELAPLACPIEGDDVTTVAESDAVRLFVKRARDAGGVIGDDHRALGAIVRRLDGIPLAIELAAARTRLLSVGELAQRLASGNDVLARVIRRAESRHSTLASAIEWSWSLLSPEEQSALARCSVFAGSFTLEAAERIVGEGARAIELIAALRDKSLVHATADNRLGLYVSIRDYALGKLCEMSPEEPDATRLAHARSFAEMARRFKASRSLQDTAPEPGLHAKLRCEKENLTAALSFVRGLATTEETALLQADLAVAIALLSALPAEACAAELSSALEVLGASHPVDAASILITRQSVLTSLGRYSESLRDLDAIVAIPGIPRGFALLALVYKGIQTRYQGFAKEAWANHADVRPELETAGLPRLRTMNEACMGRLMCDLRDFASARTYNERALALSDDAGDSWLGALALANLAQVAQEEQHFERARELLVTALERLRNAGELQYEAIYSTACGDLFFEWGNHDVARRWYDTGTRLLGSFMAHRQTALLRAASAALEAHDGDIVRAQRLLEIARRSASRGLNRLVDLVVDIHAISVDVGVADERSIHAVVAEAEKKIARLTSEDDPRAALTATSFDARFALRMARRAVERAHPTYLRTLRLARGGRWFEVEGARVDLGRRGALRRILVALAERHAASPARGIGQEELVAAGWPGERVLVDAGATRVRVAIATLRRLGLRSMLLTRDDGYVIDPSARVDLDVTT